MNYLAHFLLADPRSEWIAGGLAGDFIKGPLDGRLPAPIEQGIRLHRRIDACSDSLPGIRQFRRGLPECWRRYAGPVLDLLFDRQLARNWKRYHDASLDEFSTTVDRCLDEHGHWLGHAARRFALRMRTHRLLSRYVEDEVIYRAVLAIARRSRDARAMRAAYQGLCEREQQVEILFDSAFPEIRAAAEQFKNGLAE